MYHEICDHYFPEPEIVNAFDRACMRAAPLGFVKRFLLGDARDFSQNAALVQVSVYDGLKKVIPDIGRKIEIGAPYTLTEADEVSIRADLASWLPFGPEKTRTQGMRAQLAKDILDGFKVALAEIPLFLQSEPKRLQLAAKNSAIIVTKFRI